MDIPKQEFNLRNLPTKSVTLFPSRAQIVREIKDLQLAPGVNEIKIIGLTPTADEDSIKVEGSGSAVITDIAVELLPNAEIFDEIYPPEDLSDVESDDDSPSKPEFSQADALDRVRDAIAALEDEVAAADEKVASAKRRLAILDEHASVFDEQRNLAVAGDLETYRAEREKVFADRQAGLAEKRSIEKRLPKLREERLALEKLAAREKRRAGRADRKARLEGYRKSQIDAKKREVRIAERARVRKERENFWPKFVYSVTISLDASAYTPVSSRRGSVASEAEFQLLKESASPGLDAGAEGESSGNRCGLLLTYVTSAAFWSPSYDLQLSTTSNAATLSYEAQLTNATSETWSDAKITLSTSQTTFSGLEDDLPTLVPWHLKLAGRRGRGGISVSSLTGSQEEKRQNASWDAKRKRQQAQKPRANLFGVSRDGDGGPAPSAAAARGGARSGADEGAARPAANFVDDLASYNLAIDGPPRARKKLAGLGSLSLSRRPAAPVVAPSGYAPSSPVFEEYSAASPNYSPDEEDFDNGDHLAQDDQTILEVTPELDFQDSAMEETGLTTTYDLPGSKTLPPRSLATKQRIARVAFSGVVFNHTVVAKYKPVAYLKAKIRNSSKLTLLRGPAGLTLDGSFMGRTRLPRCSAGDSFLLSLGIDPDMHVTYPKPQVRRSTSGFLAKEDSSVYSRAITLVNTRAGAAGDSASIYVLDQVPVSEDAGLRVEVISPKGMNNPSGAITGVPARGPEDKDWGKAVAKMKKGGEVEWEVTLKAGKGVKLALEYEVACPAGEGVFEC
ncbi:uncharacterized protein DNG_04143 [Cephalotrichum gorgonifer]|uniref:DUF4139 domain-containing protein n=1 Tax=Cephalotrichum gorgonifer TaxID=2041049 RepID=A0AAE8SUA1_9PEZI|nr:uncharacterized protein DNG_04143 [Cephalotrichum gorgonifer]